jgi:hypothetical protein
LGALGYRATGAPQHPADEGGPTNLLNVGRKLFYTAVHPKIQI